MRWFDGIACCDERGRRCVYFKQGKRHHHGQLNLMPQLPRRRCQYRYRDQYHVTIKAPAPATAPTLTLPMFILVVKGLARPRMLCSMNTWQKKLKTVDCLVDLVSSRLTFCLSCFVQRCIEKPVQLLQGPTSASLPSSHKILNSRVRSMSAPEAFVRPETDVCSQKCCFPYPGIQTGGPPPPRVLSSQRSFGQ